jgi:hypothetical protein
MVSLMHVRWLTWVTVRPAWRRAYARPAPILTARLHCRIALRAAPGTGAANQDSIITLRALWNHPWRDPPQFTRSRSPRPRRPAITPSGEPVDQHGGKSPRRGPAGCAANSLCREPSVLRLAGAARFDRAGSGCRASPAGRTRDWIGPTIAMSAPIESRSVTSALVISARSAAVISSPDLGVFAVNAAGPGLRWGQVICSGVFAVAGVIAAGVSWSCPSFGPVDRFG